MSNCRVLVVALVLAVPGVALAKSGYVRPPEPKLVRTASMPKISSPASTWIATNSPTTTTS